MNEEKKEVKVDNRQFKEKFRFVLYANDNIICERYFKINNFIPQSLNTLNFKECMDDCVDLIKKDLKSKTNVYMQFMNEPLQLTGFKAGEVPTFMECQFLDEEREEWKPTFKFEFQVSDSYDYDEEMKRNVYKDHHTIYSRIWDGSVYPKFIRTSVDLANSGVTDFRANEFVRYMVKKLNIDSDGNKRKDLIYEIIHMIFDVCSGDIKDKDYIKGEYYGDTYYHYNINNSAYIEDWAKAVKDKTIKYQKKWADK